MFADSRKNAFVAGLTIFVIFLCYYLVTASLLPKGAGPDILVTNDISRFVHKHFALPVLPDNAEELHFTPGGTTRATRPPASYIISGLLAHLSPYQDTDMFLAMRHGSSLTSALTVLVVFATLFLYFQSIAYAIAGAVLLGLMPQFTFIASYNNDDSAALLSSSLLVLSMVAILRSGVSTRTIALMAVSCGFVLMTKFTAWLLLPFAGAYTLWAARHQVSDWGKYLLISVPLIILFGGWWMLFNTYHYGWNDPLQFKVGASIIEEYRRVIHDGSGGFINKGAGYYQLLVENYKNFIGESLKATVGNLDWLRLKMGGLQYAFYSFIFIFAILCIPVVSLYWGVSKLFPKTYRSVQQNDLGFIWLLFAMIVFQVFMYVRFNIYHDIQIQGKYILPIMLPLLILFFSSVNAITSFVSTLVSNDSVGNDPPENRNAARISAVFVLIAIIAHVDGYRSYVIPFYNPPSIKLVLGEFKSVDLDQNRYVEDLYNLRVSDTDNGWFVESTGKDPRMFLKSDFCAALDGYSMIKIELNSLEAGEMQIFIDSGSGFTADQLLGARYKEGENSLLISSGIRPCRRVRIDPMKNSGQMVIKSIAVAPMTIREVR